jgi:sec-independent protein translocase protein TatA
VGRSLGKGIIEFKKGLRGIEDELDFSRGGSSSPSYSNRRSSDDHARSGATTDTATSVPKFEPPTSTPVHQMEYEPQQAQD